MQDLLVRYRSDVSDAVRGVDQINRKQGEVGKGADQVGKKWDAIGTRATSVGKKMSLGLTAPIVAGAFVAIKSLQRIGAINAQTGAAIQSTGGAANVTGKHVEKMAGSIEKLTGAEAETVQEGANLLLTFKGIRNEAGGGNDIFDQTTSIMTDMAIAMNKGNAVGADFKSTAIQLGKALNDPAKGMTALTRVGVTFTDQQKKQVEALVESGDVMGAQKIILAELKSEFGGSGAAFGATDAGKAAIAMHQLGAAGEGLAAILLPTFTAIAQGVGKAAQFIADLPGPARTAVAALLGIAAVGGPILLAVGKIIAIAPKLKFVATAAQGVARAMVFLGSAGLSGIRAAASGMASFAASAARATVATVGAVARQVAAWAVLGVQSLLHAAKVAAAWLIALGPIGIVIAAVVGASILIIKHWDKVKGALLATWNFIRSTALSIWNGIKTGLTAIWNAIKAVVTTYFNVYKTIIVGAWNAIRAVTSGVWNAIRAVVSGAANAVRGAVSGLVNAVRSIWSGGMNALSSMASAAWERVKSIFNGAWNFVSGIVSRISGALSKLAFWRSSPSQLEVNAAISTKNVADSFKTLRGQLEHEVARFPTPGMGAPGFGGRVVGGDGASFVAAARGDGADLRRIAAEIRALREETASRAEERAVLIMDGREIDVVIQRRSAYNSRSHR